MVLIGNKLKENKLNKNNSFLSKRKTELLTKNEEANKKGISKKR